MNKEEIKIRLFWIMVSILIAGLILLYAGSKVNAREMVLQAEGTINIYSTSGNNRSTSAVLIEGDGEVNYSNKGNSTRTSHRRTNEIEITAAQETTTPISAITSSKVINGNGVEYLYALKVAPSRGQTASINKEYKTSMNDFATLKVESEVFVEQGVFRNYIDIRNEVIGRYIYEEIFVDGFVFYLDSISISDLDNNN